MIAIVFTIAAFVSVGVLVAHELAVKEIGK